MAGVFLELKHKKYEIRQREINMIDMRQERNIRLKFIIIFDYDDETGEVEECELDFREFFFLGFFIAFQLD